MYPIPDGLVPAYNTTTGEKRHVPPHWIDKDTSPFPGQWQSTPSTAETRPAAPTPSTPTPPAAPPATDPKGN